MATRTLSRQSRKARSRAGWGVAMYVLCFERVIELHDKSYSSLLITLAPVMQSASLTARSGFLLPLSSSSSRTPPGSSLSSPATATAAAKSLFPDRYHLGGPTSVRHFRLNSLGPKDVGDHLGGDAYYALGASLLTPFGVPALWRNGATRATEGGSWWSNENLKGHVWLNAGKLIGTGTPYLPLLSRSCVCTDSILTDARERACRSTILVARVDSAVDDGRTRARVPALARSRRSQLGGSARADSGRGGRQGLPVWTRVEFPVSEAGTRSWRREGEQRKRNRQDEGGNSTPSQSRLYPPDLDQYHSAFATRTRSSQLSDGT